MAADIQEVSGRFGRTMGLKAFGLSNFFSFMKKNPSFARLGEIPML